MFSRIAVFAMTFALAQASVINQSNGDIPADSAAGRKLVQNARRVENGQYNGGYGEVNWQEVDTSFIPGYSVKFQGCHHVQQWNDEADGEEDIKIMTQRLVRFRMCPADTCSSSSTKGCDANYGDYLVDMETYMEALMNQMQYQYSGNRALESNNGMNMGDYMQCTEMEMNDRERQRARELRELNAYGEYNQYYYNGNGNQAYYIGPYCAEQGGEIRLGVFLDDTCTVSADNGEKIFEMVHGGMSLPYSDKSFVNLGCSICGGNGQVTEMCDTLYQAAGKCETKMNVYYPNESACGYIDGIKVIREDGVIRTSTTRKSTAAAITTGLFLTAALLLSGYVYYLRTKLGRARVNLAASSQNAGL